MNMHVASSIGHVPSKDIHPSLPPPAPPLKALQTKSEVAPEGLNISPQEPLKTSVVASSTPPLEKVAKTPPKALNGTAGTLTTRNLRPSWPDDEISSPTPGAITTPANPLATPTLTRMEKPVSSSNVKYIMDSQCHYVVTLKEFRQGDLTSPHPDQTTILAVYTYAEAMMLTGRNLADKLLNQIITHGDHYLNDTLKKGIEEKTLTLRTVYPNANERKKVLTVHLADAKAQFGSYRIFTVERIQGNTMYNKVV